MLASTSPITSREPCVLKVAAEETVHHSYIDLGNFLETSFPIGVGSRGVVPEPHAKAAQNGNFSTSCRVDSFLPAGLHSSGLVCVRVDGSLAVLPCKQGGGLVVMGIML